MIFPERFRKRLAKKKTKEELDKHYDGIELEKGDFAAMVIAAVVTFLPVLIIAMVFIYGLIWLLFLR
jgi:hypothetical protein